MNVRLSQGETPYWLFGLIFLIALTFLIIEAVKPKGGIGKLKPILLWFLIIIVIGSSFTSAMIVRHKAHPIYQIHDMPLQQEIAIRFLLDGKNPYATNYSGTFLEEWHYSDKEKNPALYHFVLLPFYIIFALPFYLFGNSFFGFFDARMPLLFLFALLLFIANKLPIVQEKKNIFVALLAFNPAMLAYTLEGRSDIFMFSFLFTALYFVNQNKFLLSGIFLGAALAVKQSAWPILPFYFAFIYFKTKSIKKTIKTLLPFAVMFTAIVLPFILWDAKAFFESTIFYLSGGVPNSYPISGYGLGMVLSQIGIIKDVHSYYPFYIWQAVVGLPLFIILLSFMKKRLSVKSLIFVYGVFLFVFWYMSRYFNNSHLGYLSMVFITYYFWPENKTDA